MTDLEAIAIADALDFKVKLAVQRQLRRENFNQALTIASLRDLNSGLMKENERLRQEIDRLTYKRSRVLDIIRNVGKLNQKPSDTILSLLEELVQQKKLNRLE